MDGNLRSTTVEASSLSTRRGGNKKKTFIQLSAYAAARQAAEIRLDIQERESSLRDAEREAQLQALHEKFEEALRDAELARHEADMMRTVLDTVIESGANFSIFQDQAAELAETKAALVQANALIASLSKNA